MALCAASTLQGTPCANVAVKRSAYCHIHSDKGKRDTLFAFGVGAILAPVIVPGLGGMLLGGLSLLLIQETAEEILVTKKRVFVSFDFDNDKRLKDFIIGQSKLSDSPFSVVDHSLKEAAPERNWKDKARAAIKRSDIVVVMVGPYTSKAPGVLAEVAMAREEGIPIVQVIGYTDGGYTAVPNAGRLYRWNWSNLKNLLG